MKKRILALLVMLSILTPVIRADWKPAGDKIKTPWAEKIDVKNVLPEYPRPLMERSRWQNLNGLWKYAILPLDAGQPGKFDGDILVPFAIESSLSGVMKTVGEKNNLWYQRAFSIPEDWRGDKILLNFGAVDWKADVWVNGVKVGSHTGGYTPFSFDITSALKSEGENILTVKVWDPTDKSYIPRGKQVQKPHGIWYTAVTGIWQTVWLEPVGQSHISAVRTTPDIDAKNLKVRVCSNDSETIASIEVFDGEKVVAKSSAVAGEETEIAIPAPKLWSPDSPFLYGLKIDLLKGGKVCDSIKSYAAMRKISIGKSKDGRTRMRLNNKELYHMGPLDQGWWPDGLYTAPTDEALAFDIIKTKELGFNMIRKHVKVEPARWYTHCDKIGMLVWQDMPSGGESYGWTQYEYIDYKPEPNKRSPESEANYRKEWSEIMNFLHSNPCIVVWVPFNEAWGQFKTVEITEWTKACDPSRLVNSASGGNFFHCGDITDMHRYPAPSIYLLDFKRANAIGEYGGIGMAVEGHLWFSDKNWGYVQFKTPEEVTKEYVKFADMLLALSKEGICAGVYTQTTDVEGEVNGLYTYDRKVLKVDANAVREANLKLVNSLK